VPPKEESISTKEASIGIAGTRLKGYRESGQAWIGVLPVGFPSSSVGMV